MIEISRLIVKYLAKRITKMADEIWEQKNWTNDDMDELLTTHKRTPYKTKEHLQITI